MNRFGCYLGKANLPEAPQPISSMRCQKLGRRRSVDKWHDKNEQLDNILCDPMHLRRNEARQRSQIQ
jgi:hypothetical protein